MTRADVIRVVGQSDFDGLVQGEHGLVGGKTPVFDARPRSVIFALHYFRRGFIGVASREKDATGNDCCACPIHETFRPIFRHAAVLPQSHKLWMWNSTVTIRYISPISLDKQRLVNILRHWCERNFGFKELDKFIFAETSLQSVTFRHLMDLLKRLMADLRDERGGVAILLCIP